MTKCLEIVILQRKPLPPNLSFLRSKGHKAAHLSFNPPESRVLLMASRNFRQVSHSCATSVTRSFDTCQKFLDHTSGTLKGLRREGDIPYLITQYTLYNIAADGCRAYHNDGILRLMLYFLQPEGWRFEAKCVSLPLNLKQDKDEIITLHISRKG